jgi:hypothetical protein
MLGPHSDVYRPTRADTREAIAHARQACLAAVRAIARATTVLESSRMLCAERDHWRQVWNDLKGADRDYMAVCCAYCTPCPEPGRCLGSDPAWRPRHHPWDEQNQPHPRHLPGLPARGLPDRPGLINGDD